VKAKISESIPAYLMEMGRVYEFQARCSSAPVFYDDNKGVTHNGTMTFLKTESKLIGLTNKHVSRAISECGQQGRRCNLGGTELDPNRLIVEHPEKDLATYELSDVLLGNVGILIDGKAQPNKHQPATVTTWPPKPPKEGAPVLYGGYPGCERAPLNDGNVTFGFFWVANKVGNASDRNISMVMNLEESISVGQRRLEQGVGLGGWSGGPLFRLVDENLIEHLELSAIIYEYSANTGIVFAHPITDLNPDGTFG
jgi:hypothetical protein